MFNLSTAGRQVDSIVCQNVTDDTEENVLRAALRCEA